MTTPAQQLIQEAKQLTGESWRAKMREAMAEMRLTLDEMRGQIEDEGCSPWQTGAPPAPGKYFVTYQEAGSSEPGVGIAAWSNAGWDSLGNVRIWGSNILAWMPLPAPYQESPLQPLNKLEPSEEARRTGIGYPGGLMGPDVPQSLFYEGKRQKEG